METDWTKIRIAGEQQLQLKENMKFSSAHRACHIGKPEQLWCQMVMRCHVISAGVSVHAAQAAAPISTTFRGAGGGRDGGDGGDGADGGGGRRVIILTQPRNGGDGA